MGHLWVRPRCSAEREVGRCHRTKLLPATKGTLLRSWMWRVRSNFARRDLGTKVMVCLSDASDATEGRRVAARSALSCRLAC